MKNYDQSNQFQALAARANRGDVGAVWELQLRLEPEMARIVRQVLRTPGDNSPLARRIRMAVARVSRSGTARSAPHPVDLIDRVARSLCESVISRLLANRLGGAHLRETVCN